MDVRLPNLGEGADSGTVVSILVKEGEDISAGQNLIELENGKAVVGVPSPVVGKVEKLRVKTGDKISVGQVILNLAGAKGAPGAKPKPVSVSTAKPAQALSPKTEPEGVAEEANVAGTPSEEPRPSQFPPPASPSIRKLAHDLGIDLARVKGSERGGRIVLEDVRAYIARLQKLASATPQVAKKPAIAPTASIDFSKWGSIARQPLSPLRQVIAQRMTDSWTTVPQVTQFDEADLTAIMELRKKYKAAYEKQGANLTVTVFVLKALVETLKKHPIFNTSLDEAAEEIVFKEYFNFGIAVDTKTGLIVPVIRDVDKKTTLELAKELSALTAKTRDRKVSQEELAGGTFTISNQGGIGGAHFTPIVSKPEVAILGLGRSVVKPVVKNEKIQPAMMLPIAISYDHRVIDGGAAARFTKDLVAAFENFPEKEVTL